MRNDFTVKTIPTQYHVDKWHGYLYILLGGIPLLGFIIQYNTEIDSMIKNLLKRYFNKISNPLFDVDTKEQKES